MSDKYNIYVIFKNGETKNIKEEYIFSEYELLKYSKLFGAKKVTFELIEERRKNNGKQKNNN